MPSANILVPSDITLLEEKFAIGKRRLRTLEWVGLMGMPPMLHIHYSKMDRSDMRAVLTKKYDPESKDPIVGVLKTRQEAVRKQVIAHNGMWFTGGGMAGLTWWSFR